MDYCTTIGIDVSDKTSKVCVMTKEGGGRRVLAETTCPTTPEGFAECLGKFDRSWPAVFETGTHCRWMDRELRRMGFRTIVANPAEVGLIADSNVKSDRGDARKLARIALADAGLLKPVRLRSETNQHMLRLHEARQLLMKMRTAAVVQVRCFAKSMGLRLPRCSADGFHRLDRSGWPPDFERTVWPMLDMIEAMSLKIRAYDRMIGDLAETPAFKPLVDRAREVYGVGPVGSTAIVAAIDGDPGRFAHARDVGPYLGLVPRKSQSGDDDPQLGTTKAGNKFMRHILVECANVAMGEDARDTDLKLRGLRIASRGGGIARKKAKVAVARGLAVLVVALLKDPSRKYVPLSEEGRVGLELLRAERERLAARNMKAQDRRPSAD